MMKYIGALLLAFMLFGLQISNAQSWLWGKRGGSGYPEGLFFDVGENVTDLTTDPNGNVYVLAFGYTYDTDKPDVDGHALTTYKYKDIIFTSFDCKGNYRWTKVIGNSLDVEQEITVHTDTLGGVYLALTAQSCIGCSLAEPIHFDVDTVHPPTNQVCFVVKYDTAGNYKWLRAIEPDTITWYAIAPRNSLIIDMSVSKAGNISLLGALRNGVFAGGAYAVSTDGYAVHMLKYDRDGNFISGHPMQVSGIQATLLRNNSESSLKMVWDEPSDKYYFTGYLLKGFPGLDDTLSIGDTFIHGSGYVARFDNAGNPEWVKQNNDNYLSISRPVLDKYSNIYITGSNFNSYSFNGFTFSNIAIHASPFVMKMNKDGKLIWAYSAANRDAGVGALNLALSGNILSVYGAYAGLCSWGSFTRNGPLGGIYDPFLIRMNGMNGAILAFDTLPNPLDENAHGAYNYIAADRYGNFFSGGGFGGTAKIGASTIKSAGGESDFFVAKFGTDNCDCTSPPQAAYTYSYKLTNVSFAYTGSSAVDSIVWYYGDGESDTGSKVSHEYRSGLYDACVVVYNRCGSDVYCKQLGPGTAINEVVPDKVKVYPNPTENYLTIEGAEAGVQLRLFNMVGQQVYTVEIRGDRQEVSMSALPPGNYLLQLSDRNGMNWNRLVSRR